MPIIPPKAEDRIIITAFIISSMPKVLPTIAPLIQTRIKNIIPEKAPQIMPLLFPSFAAIIPEANAPIASVAVAIGRITAGGIFPIAKIAAIKNNITDEHTAPIPVPIAELIISFFTFKFDIQNPLSLPFTRICDRGFFIPLNNYFVFASAAVRF